MICLRLSRCAPLHLLSPIPHQHHRRMLARNGFVSFFLERGCRDHRERRPRHEGGILMVSAVLAGVLASNSMQGVPLRCLNASVRRPILFNTSGNRSTLTIGMCDSIALRWAYSCASIAVFACFWMLGTSECLPNAFAEVSRPFNPFSCRLVPALFLVHGQRRVSLFRLLITLAFFLD